MVFVMARGFSQAGRMLIKLQPRPGAALDADCGNCEVTGIRLTAKQAMLPPAGTEIGDGF